MQTEKDSSKMTLSGETRQDPAYQGHLLVHLDLHGWRKGCLPPPSWLCPGPPGPGVQPQKRGRRRLWWLSHLVKLSSRSISIRKGGPLCLGLSPCRDRVH